MLAKENRLKLPVRWSRTNPDFQIKTEIFKALVKRVEADRPTKIGILITSKLGKAHERNSARRALSELIQRQLVRFGNGKEVVIITYPNLKDANAEKISACLNQVLSKIPFVG